MRNSATLGIRILHIGRLVGRRWEFAKLAAPYWRFYWNMRGRAWVRYGGERRELATEVGYVIPPDTDFSSESTRDIDHFYIHFVLHDAPIAHARGVFRVAGSERLRPIVRELITDSTRTGPDVPARSTASVLYRSAGLALLASADLPSAEVLPDPVVMSAVAYAARNVDRAVSAAELATAAGCSERTLRRRFRLTIGVSPTTYALGRRIEHACILLHFSERSIDEIAQATGFCDRYHFTRVFRNHRGMPPAAFRRIACELGGPGMRVSTS